MEIARRSFTACNTSRMVGARRFRRPLLLPGVSSWSRVGFGIQMDEVNATPSPGTSLTWSTVLFLSLLRNGKCPRSVCIFLNVFLGTRDGNWYQEEVGTGESAPMYSEFW